MTVIFGGAYQGKLAYAKQAHSLLEQDLFICKKDATQIDFSKKAICYIDSFILSMILKNQDPMEYIQNHIDDFSGKIIIGNDLSCGIVPANPIERRFREENGRVLSYLCKQAKSVTRIFCSLPLKLK